MNYEVNRLRSFNSWPDNCPIQPEILAKSGFFATGNLLETECFRCHKKINDWEYGDEIMTRHRNLSPMCDVVTNPTISENVPIINFNSASRSAEPQQSSQETVVDQASTFDPSQFDMKFEVHRLATFKNWPNPNISPQSLAKAGFYYLNKSDQVKCAWCEGVIAKWEKQDNAFEEHQRFFPECPRVQLGPLIEIASDGIKDLGIQQISPPKKVKYSSLDSRLRSYVNWPISYIQKPEALAQAGLYYQDIDDQVRCFHCNIGLRSWQKEDDPWFEHAKWFPNCQFVKLVKGQNYVAYVQEEIRKPSQTNCGEGECNVPSERSISIEYAMTTSPVLQALEMGLNGAGIRNATRHQIEATGRPYDKVEDLVNAVLNEQAENEDDDETANGPESSHSIVLKVSRIINNMFGPSEFKSSSSDPSSSAALLTNNISAEASKSILVENLTPSEPCSSKRSKSLSPEAIGTSDTRIKKCDLDSKMSLEEENRKLKDARLCKVCLDEEVGVVFLPCGHLVTCVQCAPGVTQCPLCRSTIKGFVRTYLS